ncbi:MAG: hypothetical protein MI757_23110 [Pirellulales bacterium]|nr:hypothetical protein [Pirellulales bacterium]
MLYAENGVGEVSGTRFGGGEQADAAGAVGASNRMEDPTEHPVTTAAQQATAFGSDSLHAREPQLVLPEGEEYNGFTPRRATATVIPPNLFGGDPTRQTAEEEFCGNVPDESKDDLAIRLRTAGLTFREIGAQMGVDPSMAHRRVKRAMIRRRCEMQDRMEDVRDLEFEKLRIAERALMPQVAEGDHDAIRLLVRIIEVRKRYLKDLPYERVKDEPWIELMEDDDIPGLDDNNPLEEEMAAEEQTAVDQENETSSLSEAERKITEQTGTVEGTEWFLHHELTPGTPAHLSGMRKLRIERERLIALKNVLEREASKGASTSQSTSQSKTESMSKQSATQSRKGAKDRKGKE